MIRWRRFTLGSEIHRAQFARNRVQRVLALQYLVEIGRVDREVADPRGGKLAANRGNPVDCRWQGPRAIVHRRPVMADGTRALPATINRIAPIGSQLPTPWI